MSENSDAHPYLQKVTEAPKTEAEVRERRDFERQVRDMPGMKQNEFTKCLICHKGMAHSGHLTFYRLQFERLILDARAIQRAHGLEMMMGGAAALASVMGPNEDLAKVIAGPKPVLICEECADFKPQHIAVLSEMALRDPKDGEG